MRYFKNLASRATSSEISKDLQAFSKQLPRSGYNRRGYTVLNQEELKLTSVTGDSSSDEDLFAQHQQMVTKGNYNMRQEFEKSYEELIDSKRKIRKIRIILLILTIFFFITLIIVAVILIINYKQSQNVDSKAIGLDSILSGQLSPKRFNGTWGSSSTILYKDIENGNLLEYDLDKKGARMLLNPQDEKILQAFLYEKSADGKYLLIARGLKKIFRHSYMAIYSVVDLSTSKVYPLTINGQELHLLYAKWAPVGNGLIINHDRNLYYKPSALGIAVQLTSDTNEAVINGHPDWVYEEEVFSSNMAVWFNPSGTAISFIQFNDISTRVMNLPYYGLPGDISHQYPEVKKIYYPKAGSPNPFVKLLQCDLKEALNGKNCLSEVAVPSPLNTEPHIITTVEWLTDENLFSVWMNRIQNRAYLQVSEPSHRNEIFKIETETGWVDIFSPPLKNRDGSQIAMIIPQPQGEDGDYRHVTLLSTKQNNNNKSIPLTMGKFVVQNLIHWDHETNLIFYTANTPAKSQVLHLYAVKGEKGQQSQCITCEITKDKVKQTYFSVEFSPKGKYIVLTVLGPSIPTVDVYSWSYSNDQVKLHLVAEWESNQEVTNYISQKKIPEIEYHAIDLENGFSAKVLLQLPPNVDRTGSTKYPMLVEVYGGPDSFAVTDRWIMDWGSYLASNQSIIYAKIDGRGSGLRGDKHLHSIYMKLGTYEVYDQINVTRKLQALLPYVDASRTGIWGWSYGGYVSAMSLARDTEDIFKCATSVAPVTDWTYYDSIYTERYLGLPQVNQIGYKNARLSTLAPYFRGKKFLLVHGTLDDNVHYQQSMILAKNLEHNDIIFRQISYPDEDHGLYGVRTHLYHSLDHFFGECFNLSMGRAYGK